MSNNENNTDSLLDFMRCERLDDNLYRGQSRDLKTGQVYGGQVLGQAIRAAYNTIDDDRKIHSAHAYFLLKGDVNAPIIYEVDRSLDGGSFSSRRVVAIQHGRQIFNLSASFQRPEQGLEYSRQSIPPIESLYASLENSESKIKNFQAEFLDVYYLEPDQISAPNAVQMWIKTKETLPEDPDCHTSVLAYISDMGLLLSALMPHKLDDPNMQKRHSNVMLASIDHAIWFHRSFRADEWFFYDCRARSTGNGRGFAHGSVYAQDGTLVASTAQEGLLRVRR
ncbi:MAG: acyl-CoA thioesterase-2 [Arenicella sp.]|jgi:acyl-CoA thioesterase-2